MDRGSLVSLIVSLLSAAAIFGPVVYGLGEYGWDLRSIVTPSYEPPGMGIHVDFAGLRVEGDVLYVTFALRNTGEVEVDLTDVEGVVRDPDGAAVAGFSLVEPVGAAPMSSSEFTLEVRVDEQLIEAVGSCLSERGSATLTAEGTATFAVRGASASVPFTAPITLSEDDVRAWGWL
ncbi:MAG: hypothetical protein QFX33_03985 [Candidatus Nezhaarchaeota archaeon]|nr:hypothetical protein [Candidatus Nezhaarchaeota archaeon]